MGLASQGVRERHHSSLISPDELASRLRAGSMGVLIDVRTADEHAAWSIPGSINLPLDALPEQLDALPLGTPITVYCASGGRSARAAALLEASGRSVSDLAGGMSAWARTYDVATITIGPTEIVQFQRRGKGCLSYLVVAGGEALAIDPSSAVGQYTRYCDDRGVRLVAVVDTHLHADHISGAQALAAATGADLYLSGTEGYAFPHIDAKGRTLPIGDPAVLAQVHEAPGHTGGSILLDVAGAALFTGDTLFVDGVGRPDLADAIDRDAIALHGSLRSLVAHFSDGVWVLPAHTKATAGVRNHGVVGAPLGTVRGRVPELDASPEAFLAHAREAVSARPANAVRLVELNRSGGSIDEEALALEIGPNRCAL